MNTFKITVAAILLTGLCATAATTKSSKKQARTAANIGGCVDLNKVFTLNEDVSLEELQALRNSIFAQHGYKFTDAGVAAEMKTRNCSREDVTYAYSKLSDIDKKNIKMFKSLEAEKKEALAYDFDKSWAKASAKIRSEMLDNQYCHVLTEEMGQASVLFFSKKKNSDGQFILSGLINAKKAKYINEEGEKKTIDSTGIAGLDSTSISTLEMTANGSWMVDAQGNIKTSIKPLKASAVKIYGTDYANSRILTCVPE